MPNLTQLRLAAREIFNEALLAVDAGAAVRHAVRLEDAHLSVCDTVIDLSIQQPIYSIAIGKAAFAMASALDEIFAGKLTAGCSQVTPRAEPLRCRVGKFFRADTRNQTNKASSRPSLAVTCSNAPTRNARS